MGNSLFSYETCFFNVSRTSRLAIQLVKLLRQKLNTREVTESFDYVDILAMPEGFEITIV